MIIEIMAYIGVMILYLFTNVNNTSLRYTNKRERA